MAPGSRVWDLSWDEAGNKHTTHTLVGMTHLVGFMRGLLPKRKDGSSSATVPFRRRNFSVRSNPARKRRTLFIEEVIFKEWSCPIGHIPVIFRGRPRMSENLCSSTMRAGHEPSKRKRTAEKLFFFWLQMSVFFFQSRRRKNRDLFWHYIQFSLERNKQMRGNRVGQLIQFSISKTKIFSTFVWKTVTPPYTYIMFKIKQMEKNLVKASICLVTLCAMCIIDNNCSYSW